MSYSAVKAVLDAGPDAEDKNEGEPNSQPPSTKSTGSWFTYDYKNKEMNDKVEELVLACNEKPFNKRQEESNKKELERRLNLEESRYGTTD